MRSSERCATWLELAVAPRWHKDRAKIALHPLIGAAEGCFVLSMDGRRLFSGNRRLTVFSGREAAQHFLDMLHIDDFEPGEATDEVPECEDRHHCLHLDRSGQLAVCPVKR